MKKNEIKRDPVRDLVISAISKFNSSRAYYLGIIALFVIVIPITFSTLSKKNISNDYLDCLELLKSLNIEAISDYCNSEPIKKEISNTENLSISKLNGILFLFKELNELDDEGKLLKLNQMDFNLINDTIIKAKMYELHGDLFYKNKEWESSSDKYLKALDFYDDKMTYSAAINFKLSQSYFRNNQLKEALNCIEEALSCSFTNTILLDRINILKARINQVEFNN